jgi:hypothetical protein
MDFGISFNSFCPFRPLGNSQTVSRVEKRAESAMSRGKGAKARAEIAAAANVSTCSSRLGMVSAQGNASLSIAWSSHSIRRFRLSTSLTRSRGRQIAITKPGKPAPVPRSSHGDARVSRETRRSCAESAKCRSHTCSSEPAETRFCRAFSWASSIARRPRRSSATASQPTSFVSHARTSLSPASITQRAGGERGPAAPRGRPG